jgi:hypothetical protein
MSTYFTVPEANAMLPRISPIMEQVQEWRRDMAALRSRVEEITPQPRRNGHSAKAAQLLDDGRRLREVRDRINAAVERVVSMGVEVKDLDTGLVDFPSLREGREIYLCWRIGEQSVDHWHEVDSGFQGRQPL